MLWLWDVVRCLWPLRNSWNWDYLAHPPIWHPYKFYPGPKLYQSTGFDIIFNSGSPVLDQLLQTKRTGSEMNCWKKYEKKLQTEQVNHIPIQNSHWPIVWSLNKITAATHKHSYLHVPGAQSDQTVRKKKHRENRTKKNPCLHLTRKHAKEPIIEPWQAHGQES
jgi:hypothetical protein